MTTKPYSNAEVIRLCIRFLRYAWRRWQGLAWVLLIMMFRSVLEIVKPLPMKILIDNVLTGIPLSDTAATIVGFFPGAATSDGLLLWTVAATIVLFFMGWLLDLTKSYAQIGIGQRMVYDLAEDVYTKLQSLSLRLHGRRSTGDLIRRITTDTGSISTIIIGALLPIPIAIFTVMSMFFVMWQLDSTLTLLSLLVVPFMVLTLRKYSGPMTEISYRKSEEEGRIYGVVEQTLSAMPIIKAYNREDLNESKLREVADRTLDATIDTYAVQMRFKVFIGLATAVGTAGVILIGGFHVLGGQLTVGSILVFIAYLTSLYGPIESLMYTSMTINQAAGSGRRVVEMLDAVPEVVDRIGAVSLNKARGELVFEGVGFGYQEGSPVLHDISFTASAGETIAIVGPTGAGKTTLVSLVPRFYDPETGRILLDGQDLRDIKLRDLRDNISIVLQDSFLFPVSIADNISYGKPGASRDEIEEAARAANIDEFIRSLPEGYETIVGERGATLSGGERQRISIARALLKDAPILILDEPTSSIDVKTEEKILEALSRLMKGRTTLVIAHRLSTVRNSDRIIVLENGSILECGDHTELMGKSGLYASLYETQFGSNPLQEDQSE